MKPPIIRVDDGDSAAPLILHYTHGENHLDLRAIYADMQTLNTDHPGRARFDLDTHNVVPCSEEFLDMFWSIAASLLDYFADFYATDTALMQSIWFHILDQWQRISRLCIYHGDFDSRYSRTVQMFEKDYNDTIDLIHRLVFSRSHAHPYQKTPPDHSQFIIHDPTGNAKGLAGRYETGPFISGLKPWQQFLYSGAPGFKPISLEGSDAQLDSTEAEAEAVAEAEENTTTRYIPQPAIALIQAHTARARTRTAQVAEEEGWDLPETLSAFDAQSLAFPAGLNQIHTYPSLLRPGKSVSYQLVQGAPPVKRHEGLMDPSMMIDQPDLMLLDEAVGSCKGTEAYVPMTGPVGREGVGFDVWRVEEGVGGWVGGGNHSKGGVLGVAVEEMFDEWYDWCVEDEK
jgi:hypothetical protein